MTRRIFLWALVSIAAAMVSPVIVQGVRLESYHSEIAKLIDSAAPAERELPQPVRDLLLFSLRGYTARSAARLLIEQFDAAKPPPNPLVWNFIFAKWHLFAAPRFSEQDRLTLIAHLAPTGGDRHGLDNTAQALFGHSLSDVTLAEAATLITLSRAPSLYDNPDRLTAMRDQFLSRFQAR